MNRNTYQWKHYPLSVLYHILCILILNILPVITSNIFFMVLFNLFLLSIVLHIGRVVKFPWWTRHSLTCKISDRAEGCPWRGFSKEFSYLVNTDLAEMLFYLKGRKGSD